MQKVIIDTNVLVSAMIQRSYPNLIIYNILFEDLIELCISDKIIEEYFEVLNRPKFAIYPDFLSKAELVLAQIENKAKRYFPSERVEIMADKNDNKFLELAFESKADFLITGNSSDFTMSDFKGTKIISPKEYYENFSFDSFAD